MDSRAMFVAVVVASLCVIIDAQAPTTTTAKPELKCFNCKNCGDPFDVKQSQAQTKVCAASEFYCFKLTHADKKIDRGCAVKKGDCGVTGKECLTCEKSNCNSGHRLNVAFTLPVMTVMVVALVSVLSGAVWKQG